MRYLATAPGYRKSCYSIHMLHLGAAILQASEESIGWHFFQTTSHLLRNHPDNRWIDQKGNDMTLKTVTIALLIGSISIVHIMYHGSEMGFHILHQQLFFIPLILASFWFGLRSGAIVAAITSLLYGIPMAIQ